MAPTRNPLKKWQEALYGIAMITGYMFAMAALSEFM